MIPTRPVRLLAASLLSAAALAGCRTTFEAETTVAPDGTLTRTTRFVADEDTNVRDVMEFCVLPPGGAWRDQPGRIYSWREERETEGTVHVYEATQRFGPGASIPSDYQRRGRSTGEVAGNAISLRVSDWGFGKTFEYRERYRDVATRESAMDLLLRSFSGWVERFADALPRELSGSVTSAQARAAIEGAVGPAMTRLVRGISEEGAAFFKSPAWTDDVLPMFGRDAAVAAVMQRLTPPEDARAGWEEALRRAHDGAGDLFETSGEQDGLEERVFGVHGGPSGLKLYRFRQRLVLPGEVTASNATRREADALLWEFEPDAFLWQDYVLEARSRLWLPQRLLAAAAAALLLVVLGVGVRRTRRRRPPTRRARRSHTA